jgi:hypothetical protein
VQRRRWTRPHWGVRGGEGVSMYLFWQFGLLQN